MRINSAALGIESFTFGGVLSDDMDCVMEKKSIGYPTIREKNVELPNRPGVVDASSRYPLGKFGSREVEVTIGLLADIRMDEEKAKHLFYSKMQLIETADLLFSGTPDRVLRASVTSITWERVAETAGATIIKGTIKFLCADPFAYDATGPVTVNISTEINNTGDISADVIYNITMGVTTPTITLTMGSSILRIDYGFVNGDSIQISSNGQIVHNSNKFLIPRMSVSKNFLEIPIGIHTLVSTATISGTIQYRRRYLGI
jgi:phage-related protein